MLQTTDRQTYSEREREFTFAKNCNSLFRWRRKYWISAHYPWLFRVL